MRDFTAGGDDTLLALSYRVPSLYAETTTYRIFPRFYIRGLGNIDFYLGPRSRCRSSRTMWCWSTWC